MKAYTNRKLIRHPNVKRSDCLRDHVSKKAARRKGKENMKAELEYNMFFELDFPCFWIDYSEYWLVNTYSSRL